MKLKAEDKIIFIYVLFGALWIYFSDEIISSLFNEEEVLMRIQTYKGLIFVLVTGSIFYFLLKNYFKQLRDTQKELEKKNEELNKYTSQLESGQEALQESYRDLYEHTEDLKLMVDFINNISQETFNDANKFLSSLLRTSFKLVPLSDYGSVYRIKNGKVRFIDAIGHDLEKLRRLDIDQEVFATYEPEPQIIDELLMKNKNKLPKEEFQLLVDGSKDIKQSLSFYLEVEDDMIAGISLDIDRNSEAEFCEHGVKTLKAFRNIAESFYTLQRYNKLQGDFQRDIILSMIKFLEIHDKYTGGHSEEVAELSQQIAKALDLDKGQVNDAYWAGLVHDIGKLIVPSVILNKKSDFRKEDYEYIKNHPRWAYKSLSESERLQDIAEYVLYHHERWDGEGYPKGLKGKEIPLISRIVAVADVFSAMTSDRSYRDALSEEKAIQELKENKGKQFDPKIVDVFIKIIENDISETIQVN
jgi:HD-GYP domain-containing protein (c-di-GMP phosphodiesterase class II)